MKRSAAKKPLSPVRSSGRAGKAAKGAEPAARAARAVKRPAAKAVRARKAAPAQVKVQAGVATARRTAGTKARTARSAGRSSAPARRRASRTLRVTLEVGPKRKRVVAVAPDWPGLERGGKSADEAIDTLQAYVSRYARVAKLAGMDAELAGLKDVDVIERYQGSGSTDFWGISFAFSSLDTEAMSSDELERALKLVRACWKYFDGVRGRVSAEMRKGPRGGGRDRDRIVRHVLGVEQDWARKLDVRTPNDDVVLDDAGVRRYRDAYLKAIRSCHAGDQMARNWPLRYLIRHTGYHTMDHAWEMEDKDLTGADA